MAGKSKRNSSVLLDAQSGAGFARKNMERLRRQSRTLEGATQHVEGTSKQSPREVRRARGRAGLAHSKAAMEKSPPLKFPIVGIGASAGGLEAMTQLLKSLPADTGMAFVLVQHLDPAHESALSSLLSRSTCMQVTEARNNVALEPNHLYIIPPNKRMGISARRLKLFPRRGEEHLPIDSFFRSLADEEGPHAVGIVLSGSGADGTKGLLAIKAAGGLTFAQEEKSATYSAMPGNAITAGCVDFILAPEKMARELTRIGGCLPLGVSEEELEEKPTEEKAFDEILRLVRHRSGVDFTYYKHATLRRRIQRRMILHKFGSLENYKNFLRGHSAEVKELFEDILIHVTGFFRDPAVFQTLQKKLFPRLLKGRGPEDAIRIWIPGCSTGEEVYSVAISLMELMSERKSVHPVQIFATDINEPALEKARAGFYRESIKTEVSADRLRRFFVKVEGGYRVNKTIREMCIFARQNLVNDPPFSNLDLISCRNVLIYLEPTLQRKVMPVFHYALRPTGLLMLGASETIGAFSELFMLIDKKAKVYVKKGLSSRGAVSFGHAVPEMPRPGEFETLPPAQAAPSVSEVQKQADRIVLTSYSLPGVVINGNMEVLQFRGRTGTFLEHAHGEATLNLLKMAREGLMPELRMIMTKTIRQNERVRRDGLRVRQNGHFVECSVEVIPFTVPPGEERFYLVLFEPAPPLPAESARGKKGRQVMPRSTESAELAHLREELGATRESLQTIIEEQEATNEELRSANEEIMSSNEELQSTNEELETAKEELQSTNEELTTLNDELESRNGELEQVNNDLHNLLASVNFPIVILGADLKIRRFTSMAEKMFKLIPGDIGRPITDIAMPVDIPALDKQVLDVFDSLTPRDIEIKDKQGHWWAVRIRPYKTTDHKIDGAVIALLDIDAIKTGFSRPGNGREFAEALLETVRGPLLTLDKQLVVKTANEAFFRTFGIKPEDARGRPIYDLENRQWNIPQLHVLLEEVLKKNQSCQNFELEHDFPRVGKKRFLINGREITLGDKGEEVILLAMEER